MDLDVGRHDDGLEFAEPIPDQDLDWTWPAADTFTDDSITRRIVQTCSELGSQRIRLIKIRAGLSNDVIECDTKVCFLSEAGSYLALSYTWGCPVERCQIVVDNRPQLVTVNLWRFLWQARQLPEHFSGWLWIDALSIEQSNPWEKLEQVKIITKIFGSAKCVVVWLGPAYGNSGYAMQALMIRVPDMIRWKTPRRLWASPIGPAMLELCQRPYWHRLWVYQELKASPTTGLLCGSQYAHLESLLCWLRDNEDKRVKEKVQALQKSWAATMLELIYASKTKPLRAMLDLTSHLGCTDPRDKVYAILNVVRSGHQGIEADYTSTLPSLMNQVLRNMHVTKKPTSLLQVDKQCRELEARFGMISGSIFNTKNDALAAFSDPLRQLFKTSHWRSPGEDIDLILSDVYTWCKDHDHQVIARLIRQGLPARWGLQEPNLELSTSRWLSLLNSCSENELNTIPLAKKMGKILKSFESICGRESEFRSLAVGNFNNRASTLRVCSGTF